MPSPHAFIRRALPLLGLALFVPVALAAALWWIAFHHRDWIDDLPVAHFRQIQRGLDRLYQARLSWPSKDANENGTPDWYEVSRGVDPRTNRSWEASAYVHNSQVYLGERTPLHLLCDIDGHYHDIRWPIDTEVLITANAPVLLPTDAPDGTLPTTGPIRVKLSARGRLEFHVLLLEPRTVNVGVAHARSGTIFWAPVYTVASWRQPSADFRADGWRLRELPSHVELSPMSGNFDPLNWLMRETFGPPPLLRYLVWEPHPDINVDSAFEVARADAPEEWVGFPSGNIPGLDPIPRSNTPLQELELGRADRDVFPNYEGPLLYRVIAISNRRPVAPER